MHSSRLGSTCGECFSCPRMHACVPAIVQVWADAPVSMLWGEPSRSGSCLPGVPRGRPEVWGE